MTNRFIVGVAYAALVGSLTAGLSLARTNDHRSAGVAITHVTLLDGTGSTPLHDATVIIDGDRFAAVGASASTPVPRGARVIDGSGRFLIPGLWDMHTHLALVGEDALPVLVANGITAVRDMGGDARVLRRWHDEIVAGRRLGPEVLFTSPVLESATWLERVSHIRLPGFAFPNPAWALNPALGVGTPGEAVAAVDSVAATGSAYVKIRTVESRAVYFAIARASRAKGLPLVGHSATGIVSLSEASDSGQRSIEHADFVGSLDSLSLAGRATLYEAFIRNGTWFDPTLVSGAVGAMSPDTLERQLGRELAGRSATLVGLHYMSRGMLESFRRDLFVRRASAGSDKAGSQRAWETTLRYLRDMHRAGVPMLVGTDLGSLWVFPGFSVHDELAMFVNDLGFTPREALMTATRDAAAFAGEAARAGTIAPGKRADAVLLSDDPLVDIEHTRHIVAVVIRGVILERPDLDSLLAAVRKRQ